MKRYLYLSLLPEALVASHLTPDEFGAYLAIGTQKRARGQAIFFKLADGYAETRLNESGLAGQMDIGIKKRPRNSVHLGVYRVLESIPLEVLETLHLTTEDGRVLTLRPGDYTPQPGARFHLYQEFAPVTPRVVSTLEPRDFGARITDAARPVSLPALVFTEMQLARLADDPNANGVENLPYPNLEHLRDCLRELRGKAPGSTTKTVIRYLQQDVLFRTIQGGFYVAAAGGGFRFYPMPTKEELERDHYPWWRSALSTFGA